MEGKQLSRAAAPDRLPGSIRRAVLPAAALALTLVVAGCAGKPEPVSEPDPALAILANARTLIEGAAPEQLRRAIASLRGVSTAADAASLSGLASAMFELLYPELLEAGYLNDLQPLPDYQGPYRETLTRALSGRPPQSGVEPSAEEFLSFVMPCLFLARVSLPPSEPSGSAPQGTADLSSCLELLQRAETRNSTSVLPPYLSARIEELDGAPARALALYRESAGRAGSFYPARLRLATLLLQTHEPAAAEEAAAALEQVVELLPGEPSIRYSLALAYFQAGEMESASAATARALIEDPDQPPFTLLRARVLVAQGNWSQALRAVNLLLTRHPENREAYLLGAEILYERARRDGEALELLREAENQFPEAPEFPELAGRILLETGRNAEGLNQLQQAYNLDPGRVSTLRLLLGNAVKMRRWLQAAIYLSEILERESSPEELRQAIRIYRNLGDQAQVLFYAERLYTDEPSAENLVLYARALLQAEKTEEARSLVERGLEGSESPAIRSGLHTLQALLVEAESPEQALQLLRQALLENPDNLEAVLKIADLYSARRELRKASLYLKHAIELDPDNTALKVELEGIEQALNY